MKAQGPPGRNSRGKARAIIARGALAGLLAAAVLALWFLGVDMIRGRPMYTPAFMMSALLGRAPAEATSFLVAAYSVFHFASFVFVGCAVAWLLQRSGIRPHLVLGAVLGFLLFDLVFYLGVIRGGANVVNQLGWPQVLVGNVLAGLALMAYLRTTAELPNLTWRERLATRRVLREGIVSGLIGAGAIAAWFFVLDLARGRPFFTPAALGSVLFLGARRAADVQMTFGTVFGFTIIHIAVFLMAGYLAATLLNQAEKHPSILLGIALLFVTFEVLFFGVMVIVASWLIDVLQSWTVIVSNFIAAAAMGVYLLRKHPALRAELNKPLEEDEQVAR